VDEDAPEGPLGRFAVELDQKLDLMSGREEGVFTLIAGRDVNRVDGADTKYTGAFLVSAGGDRKVRFWDLAKAEASSVVSGLELEEPRPTFGSLQVPITLPKGPFRARSDFGGRSRRR
jgi:phosphoinositide-3-kinase, regulatory subunit 4